MKPSNRKDMTLRRKLRRGLALVLAVVLVAGLGLSYSPDRVLRAEEVTAETPAVEKTVHREASAHKEPEPAPAPEPEPAKEDAPAPANDDGGDTVELQIEAPADNSGQAAQGGGTSNAVNEEELVLDAEGAADEGQTDEETAEEPEEEPEEEFWTVTFYNRDAEVHRKVKVEKGKAIGGEMPEPIARDDSNAYWALGQIVKGGQGNEIRVTGRRISGNYKPDSDTVVVPDYDTIEHTVTFYDSEGGNAIASEKVGPETNYCLNDIPAVPAKEGYHGKWVYSGGNFSNQVVIRDDTAVWAAYDQNVFNVTFKVDGSTYATDTYFEGDKLDLPEEPVGEGREFAGWFAGETEYKGGEEVSSDLNLTAKFTDKYKVSFVIDNGDGQTERLSQYFRQGGEKIGTMPQDPFAAGKVFEKWVDQDSGNEVTAETVVDGNMTVVAQFREVGIYNIKAEYYYINDKGKEVVVSTDLMQAEAHELPYTITAPATLQTDPNQVSGAPAYYPETPSVTLDKGDFKNNSATVRIKYVKNTAVYDIVYLLKNLDGNGYTEIERTRGVQGVLNSYVIPAVKAYDYYTLENAEAARITKASGQELRVLYERKNVQLTFETNGGSYVAAVTAPYGSTVQLPKANPEREGYKFNGWYTDAALSQKAKGSVELKGNTTLYAGWTGDMVEYTVVYMFEKYNDTGTSSSYVYDNSRTETAAAGTTVTASSARDMSKTGWEKDTAKNATSSIVVAADGSSVLQVYYKLKEYTFTFNAGTYSSGWNSYKVTATLTGKNVSGTGALDYTMKVKLGQDISAAWPGNATGTYKTGGWGSNTYSVDFNGWVPSGLNTRYVTKRTTVTPDMLPSSGSSMAYTAQWTTNAQTYTVNYWLQNADDDDYTNSDVYSQTYTSSSGNLSAKDISGYTYDHGNSGAQGVTEYNFYYNRDKYRIDYYYGGDLLRTREDVKFDAHINKAPYNWTPTAEQCGVDEDYSFAGWYNNASCQGDPYRFDKMPASNLVLYAKWNAPSYTVSFVNADDASQAAESQTVSKYKKVGKPANPARSGYAFEGWYTSADGDTLFDWNTQIAGDTTVYAHWARRNLSYIVHYVDEDGNPVASDKEVTNPNLVAGQEITEMAIAVAGYRPNDASITFTMAEEENSVTFVYSAKAETTGYTVRYLINSGEEGAGTAVAAEKKVSDVPSDTSSVIEMAAAVDYKALYAAHPDLEGIEFYPDSAEKTLVLTADAAQNVLTFTYSSFKHADIKLHYVDMAGNKIAADDVQRLKVGRTFTLGRTQMEGWELKKAAVGTSINGDTAAGEYKITEKNAESGLEFTLFYQKKATITALSASRQYDGTVLKLPEGQVRVEGLLDRHTLRSVSFAYNNADAEDGRLTAGVATVTPKDAVIDGPAADDYYTIRYISGTLEVTQINVTIRVEPDRWTGAYYNGEVYKAGFTNPAKGISDYIIISHEGYRSKYLNTVWDTIKAKAQHDADAAGLKYYGIAEKDAGDYSYNIDVTLADLPQDENYSVGLYVRPGRLHILPKNATVTTQSAAKTYDGTALTQPAAAISGLAAADEGKVKITGTGSQTEIGESSNGYDINWGGVKEGNYAIVSESLGTLTVTPGAIILTAASDSKTYDGKPFANNKVTAEGLPEGFTIKAEASGSITDAGSVINEVKDGWVIRDASGADVTGRFTVSEKVSGTLTVNRAPATVTTGSAGKAYDGKPLTNAEAAITGLVNGETAKVTATGSQTEVGAGTNTFSIDWGNVNAANYDLTENLGILTVTDSETDVVLMASSSSKTYDGEELTSPEVTASGLPDGFTLEAEAEGSITDAGKAENVIKDGYVIRNAAGEDKTANFRNISRVNGTLTVNPKTVTVTTGSASKAYDGTALTNADAKIEGLVEGERAEATATGSQTEKGSSSNTYRLDWDTAKSGNYTVTENLGTLTVTENSAAIVLTAASADKTYDGSALTAQKVTASGLPEGFTVDAAATGSQTDAGSSPNVVSDVYVIRNAQGADRTSSFTNVTKVNGTLTVEKAALAVTTGSASKEYDGTALTNAEAHIDGLVGEETATITATGSQTDTGTSDNTYSIEWGTAKQGNYTISETLGSLMVTESSAEVTLTAASADKTYDGAELTAPEVTASGLPEGFTVSAKAEGSIKDAGTADNIVAEGYVIRNAAGEDRTASFTNIKLVNGTLTVAPKPVTVTTGSGEKAYDGAALTNAEASIDGLVSGETAKAVATGSQTEVGSSENGCDITWGSVNADNYSVTEQLGTLTVTASNAEVTLTAPSAVKVYDGAELTADGTGDNKVIASGLPEGFTVEATASGSQTDAGSSANVVDDGYVILNAAGEDKTENFTNVKKAEGTLEVTARPLLISTGSAGKPYDGKPLTCEDATVTGLVEGETFGLTTTGTITEKGTADNTYSMVWAADDNEYTAKEGNYAVSETLGTLTVTDSDVDVTLTAASDAKIYDGTALTAPGVTAGGLPAGFTVEATATGSITDAGEAVNKVNDGFIIRNAAGEDKTANFKNVEKIDGTLTVSPKAVTITTASDSKAYDGKPLTKAEARIDGLVAGETYGLAATGSVTEVGSADNTYSMVWAEGGNAYTAKAGNYTVTESLGKLTVTANSSPVTLTAASGSKEYDGEELTNATVTAEGLPAGFTAEAEARGSQKNAGSSANTVRRGYVIKNADGEDRTDSFTNISTVDGTLTVTPKKVKVITGSANKEYDGTALTSAEAEITGLVGNDNAKVTANGSQTEVGESSNTYDISWGLLGLGLFTNKDNYEIEEELGTLKVTKNTSEVTLTAASASKVYDGTDLTDAGVTAEGLPEGFTVEAAAEGSQKDAGVGANKVGDVYAIKDSAGADRTAWFTNVKKADGSLTVNKRKVTLESATDEKVYDGTALVNSAVTVGGDGFAAGEGASFNVSGMQKDAGSSSNAFSYLLDAGTDAGNYDITKTEGTLTVTPVEDKVTVTITEHSGSAKYDGYAKNVSGYDVSADNALYPVSAVRFSGNAAVSGTDAGSYPMELSAEDFSSDSANFPNVEFTVVDGTLEIGKRLVTLTSASDSAEYTGMALINHSITVGGDGFADGEGASYTVTGFQKIVGASKNIFEYLLKNGTKDKNYIISTVFGDLTILNKPENAKYEVSVTANSGKAVYDGAEHSVSGLVGASENGDVKVTAGGNTFTVSGLSAEETQTNAGTYTVGVTGTPKVKDDDGSDVTKQFIVKMVPGSLTISKRNVTLTSATVEAEYSGSALTKEEVTVGGDGFAENEGASYKFSGSRVTVGTSENTFTYTLNNGTHNANYNISVDYGTLTVKPRKTAYSITLEPNSLETRYDGSDKSVSGFRTLSFNVEGNEYTVEGVSAKAEGRHAGKYPVGVSGTAVVRDAAGRDVTSEFNVKTAEAALTITPRQLTLTSANAERKYNGSPLTKESVTVDGDGFAAGEGATYSFTGSQTIVGESDNTFTYSLNEGTREGDYEISTVNGKLKVTDRGDSDKYKVTVRANSDSVKYDGKEHEVSGLEGADGEGRVKVTADGHEYTVSGLSASASGKDAGTYEAEVKGKAVVTDASGNDVTAQFAFETEPGSLGITKRRVTLTSASAEKEYDGKPLTKEEVTVGGDKFADGEDAEYSFGAGRTIVGISSNSFEYDLTRGTKADNYDITTEFGTLTVTNRNAAYDITLQPLSLEAKYDGTDKSVEGFETLTFKVAGNDYTVEGVSAGASGMHADTYPVNVKGKPVVKDAAGNDVSAQFRVTAEPGTLTITRRQLTLTSADAEKEYDGSPLTMAAVTAGGDGFAAGEGAAYSFIGSQTVVGESENTFAYTLNAGTRAEDYDITTANGTLKVIDRPEDARYTVTVRANSDSVKYDGKEHEVSGLAGADEKGGVKVTAGGHEYTVSGLTAAVKGTNAGTYDAAVEGTAKVTDAAGNDVTAQFTVETVPGSLTIAERSVIITSASAEAEYSGSPLTSEKAEVSGDGFAEGEGAAYTFSGTQTVVGMSENTFGYTLNEGTFAGNYDISTSFGTLTVTPRAARYGITLEPVSLETLYDGTDKEVEGFRSLTFTVAGHEYTVEGVSAARTERHAGTYAVNAVGTAVVKDAEGNDVTSQFEVIPAQGTLTIGRRQVTLTSADDEKEYDGKALRNHKVTVGGDGFAEGEGAEYSFSGSQTLVGTSSNSFTYTLNDGVLAEDYDITSVSGMLAVNGREGDRKFEITLEANSGSALYDGKEHSVSGFSSTEFTFGGVTYKVSGIEAGVSATDAGRYSVQISGTPVVTDAQGNDVTDQFRINIRGGAELVIGRRSITMTSGSAEAKYNGEALTNDEVTVSGDGFAEGEGASYDVTGSRTVTGMSENAFTYALSEGTKAANYDISTVFGQLTVTSRDAKYGIVLRPKSLTEKYDGTDKTVEGFESLSFLVDGSEYTVDNVAAACTAKNAGTYAVSVTGDARVLDKAGNDVTDEFEVTSVPAALTITPRQLTLTSADASKTYDGRLLRNGTVTVSGDGFAKGEGAAYSVTGSRLLPGVEKNSFTYTLDEGTLAANYDIFTAFGMLTVTNRDAKYEITVDAAGADHVYDGTEKTVEGFESLSFTVGGVTYTVDGLTAGITATDAGEYTSAASGTPVVRDEAGNDVTEQFAVSVQPGRLVIKPRQVVMTSGSATHAYNGRELTNDEVTVTGDGFAEGEGASYEVTGSRTTVGISDNTFSYMLNSGTSAANYEITKVLGKLTVTNRDAKYILTLTPNSDTVMYDGEEHSVEGFVSTTAVIDGESYEISGLTAGASGVNAGTYDVSVAGTAVVTDSEGNDVTDQFSVVSNAAALTITPRKVVLRSPDESVEYSGRPEGGSGKFIVEGDGFVGDDGVVVTPTAGRTLVGATENSFDWVFSEGTNPGNYSVEIEYGTLSVVSRDALYEISMKANSDTVEYDGEEHSVSGFETNEFEVEGNTYTVEKVEAAASGTEAGVYPTEISGAAEVKDAEGNDVTDEFAVSYEGGTLTITGAEGGDENADDNKGGNKGGNGNADNNGGNGIIDNGGGNNGGGDIPENTVPYAPAPSGYWALLNLIMTIISVLIGIIMLVRRAGKKDDEEDDGTDPDGTGSRAAYAASAADAEEEDQKDERKKKRMLSLIAAVLLAIGSVIAFILTEDLTNTMAFIDRYTILMAILLAGSVVSFIFRDKDNDDEEEQGQEEPASGI